MTAPFASNLPLPLASASRRPQRGFTTTDSAKSSPEPSPLLNAGAISASQLEQQGGGRNLSRTVNKKETQRKSEVKAVKQSSPRSPRNSSPRQSDANTVMLLKLLCEPSAIPNPPEKNGHKWKPNNLSEKLMKCLICIYLRLIRTSRMSDQERSGNLSRSPTSMLRSRTLQLQSSQINLKSYNMKTWLSFLTYTFLFLLTISLVIMQNYDQALDEMKSINLLGAQ